jgi:hypothetical protein
VQQRFSEQLSPTIRNTTTGQSDARQAAVALQQSRDYFDSGVSQATIVAQFEACQCVLSLLVMRVTQRSSSSRRRGIFECNSQQAKPGDAQTRHAQIQGRQTARATIRSE